MKNKVTLKQARADARAKIEALNGYIRAIDDMIKAGIDADTPALGAVPRIKGAKKAATAKTPTSEATATPAKSTKGQPKKIIPVGAKVSLLDACKMIMADTTAKKPMSNKDVYAAVLANKWTPSSSDPEGYVRFTLSKHRELFLRVAGERGKYYLAPGTEVPEIEGGREIKKAPVQEEEPAEAESETEAEASSDDESEVEDVVEASAEVVEDEPAVEEPAAEEEAAAEEEPVVEEPPPAPPAPKAPPPKPAPAPAPKVVQTAPKAAPAPVAKAAPPPPAAPPKPVTKPVSPPKAEEEDPEDIANSILAAAGINLDD